MKTRALFAFLAACLVAIPASAQQKNETFEITPFVAYLAEGNFDDGFDDDYFDDDLEVDEGNGFGLIFGFEVNRHLDVEVSYSKSDTTLVFDEGIFGGEDEILDLDVEYLHVGANFHFSTGQIQPFVLASVGATRLSPDGDFDDETRPSVGLGGGVKFYFHDNFGLRLQGRVLSTLIDEEEDAFCDRHGCVYYDTDTYLYQAELSAGLVFAF